MLTTALALLLILDTLRLWRRAQATPRLPDGGSASPLEGEFKLFTAPGIIAPSGLQQRAARWADEEGLLVVDLLPERLPCSVALALLQQRHPIDYSQRPFTPGVTGGLAVLIHDEIIARAGPPPEGGETPYLDWIRYAQELKRYAPWQTAIAVAGGWEQQHPLAEEPSRWRAQLRRLYGASLFRGAQLSPILWGLIALAAALDPFGGLLLLALYCAQPLLILSAGPLRVRALSFSLFRPLLELRAWLRLLGPLDEDPHAPPHPDSLRGHYQGAIERGLDGLFHPPRERCPLCNSEQLQEVLVLPDLYQGKPGEFRLSLCGGCGHRFQNPQLTVEGLSFYYQDFYDGLGEEGMDLVFGASEQSYRQRINLIRASGTPKKWLDVGGGHGHFTLLARHLLPQTEFDLLDLSSSVESAARRGWTREGIRGLFVEEAPRLAGRYDGISMSHYLEHTPDPVAEIKAAQEVLEEGGLLMIEVPDPESRLGAILGRWWLPWFQPQHLHFVSRVNLSRILREAGFHPLSWEVGSAHQSVDLFFCVLLFINHIAPDPSRPWARESALAGAWRGLVFLAGLPLLGLAALADQLLRPLFARDGWSNTYRVIARRVSEEPGS